MSMITNTKLYLINFFINTDNFSAGNFMTLQDNNGYNGYDDMDDNYTDVLEGFQNMFLTHRSGRVAMTDNGEYKGMRNTNFGEDEEEDNYENVLYKDFKSFQKWNIECILKLSNEDAKFIKLLCKKILDNKLEMFLSVSLWNVTGFYFNKQGKLIIMHPR